MDQSSIATHRGHALVSELMRLHAEKKSSGADEKLASFDKSLQILTETADSLNNATDRHKCMSFVFHIVAGPLSSCLFLFNFLSTSFCLFFLNFLNFFFFVSCAHNPRNKTEEARGKATGEGRRSSAIPGRAGAQAARPRPQRENYAGAAEGWRGAEGGGEWAR